MWEENVASMRRIEIVHAEKVSSEIFAPQSGYELYTYYLACLVEYSQCSYGNNDYEAQKFADEVARISHTTIQLLLHVQEAAQSSVMVPYLAQCRPFLVQWDKYIYGSLQCKVEAESSEMILPSPLCERLAQDCAWCLHLLEKEAWFQQQKQADTTEARKKVQALSGAQFTVLQLMVKGLPTRTIADTLHLSKRTIETHQRCIYQELEVHSQREAVLIGLAAGLGTP